MHVAAEGGFERGNEFRIDIQARDECAGDRRPDPLRVVEALQDSLGALLQAFAFFRHLTQDIEARLFFRARPFQSRNFFLGCCDRRLAPMELLFRLAKILFSLLGGLPLGFHGGTGAGQIRPGFVQVARLFFERAH